jgi:long-subunit acyl-CoA synthetase (AMP-forming)
MRGSTECGNLASNWGAAGALRISAATEWKLLPVEGRDTEIGCGEFVVKTKTMFGGYFQDETRTAAAFTTDGFYRTGDVVEISCLNEESTVEHNRTYKGVGGEIKVIGRAGSGWKTKTGKWVQPESLEDFYRQATESTRFVYFCMVIKTFFWRSSTSTHRCAIVGCR